MENNCAVWSSKQLVLSKIGYSRKKSSRGGGEGWNMEFSGIMKKQCGNLMGQYYPPKKVAYPGVFKIEKLHSGVSMGLGFWSWNFQGCHTILQNLQGRGESLFSPEFVTWYMISDTSWHKDSMIHHTINCSCLLGLYDVLYYYFITIKL